MKSFTQLALACGSFSMFAMLSSTAAMARERVTGTVYQIAPTAVYVEAEDHTAVLVPISNAVFTSKGVPTDAAHLKIGNVVEADYEPEVTLTPYDIIYITPAKTERVYVREYRSDHERLVREYREDGTTVNYIWYNGRWHRQ